MSVRAIPCAAMRLLSRRASHHAFLRNVFLAAVASASALAPQLGAQGTTPSASNLNSAYTPGKGFDLTCLVSGRILPGVSGPTGSAAFNDLTENQSLGTISLNTPLPAFVTPASTEFNLMGGQLAVGDFNGDGKDDLAVIDDREVVQTNSKNIDILIGNGDGTFQSPVQINVGWPLAIATGKFDTSGNVDLAVAAASPQGDGSIKILRGDGKGNFTVTTYPMQNDVPAGIVTADFAKNGKTDLAVVGTSGDLYVFMGNGDGTFNASAAQLSLFGPISQAPGGVAAVLTASGYPDLVFSDGTVLLGNGDGTFTRGQRLPALPSQYATGAIVAADLNGDGKQDLVLTVGTSQNDTVAVQGGIAVLMGNGDGTFAAPVIYPAQSGLGAAPYMLVGDFRGIGKLDIVTGGGSYGSGFPLNLFPGNGDGTFGVAISNVYSAGAIVDGTGVTDIAAGNFSGTGTLGLAAFSDFDSSIPSATLLGWPQWPVQEVASASLTNVLFTSLVDQAHQVNCAYGGDANFALSTSSAQSLSYQQAGTPQFVPASGTFPGPFTVTILSPTSGAQIYYTTDGSTPTSNSTLYTSAGIRVTASVTINAIAAGPGYADSNVASASYVIQAPPPQVPLPVITPAGGVYSGGQTVSITDSQSGATIHYTTDGSAATANSPVYHGSFSVNTSTVVKAIAVASGYTSSMPAWAVYSFGVQSTASTLTVSGADPYTMSCSVGGQAVAGINGPTGTVTFTDVTTGQTLGSATLGSPTQSRSFWGSPFISIAGTPVAGSSYAVGDFNGDGIPDLAMAVFEGVWLSFGNGDGTFGPAVDITSSTGFIRFEGIAAADFNGDGKLDLAILGRSASSTYQLAVLLGNGDGTFQAPAVETPSYIPTSDGLLAVGYFNADPVPDLLTSSAVLLGNGDGTFTIAANKTYTGLITMAPFAGSGRDDVAQFDNYNVSVAVSNPDGTFQSPLTTPLPLTDHQSISGVAADFNNDGHLDLAISQPHDAFLMLGNGDGTFQNGNSPMVSPPTGAQFGIMAGGNFDGSANPGLLTLGLDPNGDPSFYILDSKSDGTFQTPVALPATGPNNWQIPSSSSPGTMVPVDLNGDGLTDIVLNRPGNAWAPLVNTMLSSSSASDANLYIAPGTIAQHQIKCSYSGDSNYAGSASNLVSENYTQLAEPVFSLRVGKFTGPQTVSISGSGSGVTYYYTTDGSTPTTSSTVYTAPFAISTTTTVKAIATEPGCITSNVSEAVYTFASKPHFSPVPGHYSVPQTVTITDTTSGASIYYTLDGSTPTPLSTPYTAPVAVPSNATLQAMATAPDFLNSPVASGTYTSTVLSTSIALNTSANSVGIGQPITLTATVTGSSPTGSVTFSAGSTVLGQATLTNGAATLQTSFSAAGTYSVTAAYSGDTNNAASTSSAVSIVVNPAVSTTSLTASATSAGLGQQITLTATVTGSSPTGSVTFTAGSTNLGKVTLTNGAAALATSFATAGSYTVTAAYSGDANNAASTSSAVTIAVAAPGITQGTPPGPQTVQPGGTATYALAFSAQGGYTGTITLSCSGLPTGVSCSFNPPSLKFSSGGSQSSTLSISTTAPSASLALPGSRPGEPVPAPLLFAGLTGLLFGLTRMRRLSRRLRSLACLLLLAACGFFAAGCGGGGGSSSGGGGGGGSTATPAGTYNITVNAVDATNNINQTFTVSLTVQ